MNIMKMNIMKMEWKTLIMKPIIIMIPKRIMIIKVIMTTRMTTRMTARMTARMMTKKRMTMIK